MDRPVCDMCKSPLILGVSEVWSELEQKSYVQYWCTQCNWTGIPMSTENEIINIKRTKRTFEKNIKKF